MKQNKKEASKSEKGMTYANPNEKTEIKTISGKFRDSDQQLVDRLTMPDQRILAEPTKPNFDQTIKPTSNNKGDK